MATPTVVSGLPARSTVIAASVEGTTAWVLTRGDDAGIWRVPASGEPRLIVPGSRPELVDPVFSIVAFRGEVAVLVQRCDAGTYECTRSSGTVEYFDDDGNPTHTTTLWDDEVVQAGGTPPVLLEADPTGLWIGGIDHVYALDAAGEVTETVPHPKSANLCVVEGDLYALDWEGDVSPDDPAASSYKPRSLLEWSGESWEPLADSVPPNVDALPDVSCGTDGIMLWTGFTLAAHWSPDGGWTEPTNPTPIVPATRSDAGVGYAVSSEGSLERLDPESGKLVDLGLDLGNADDPSRPPSGLVVAERGASVFACGYTYNGTSGDDPVPPTVCGFTSTD